MEFTDSQIAPLFDRPTKQAAANPSTFAVKLACSISGLTINPMPNIIWGNWDGSAWSYMEQITAASLTITSSSFELGQTPDPVFGIPYFADIGSLSFTNEVWRTGTLLSSGSGAAGVFASYNYYSQGEFLISTLGTDIGGSVGTWPVLFDSRIGWFRDKWTRGGISMPNRLLINAFPDMTGQPAASNVRWPVDGETGIVGMYDLNFGIATGGTIDFELKQDF